MRTPTTPAAPSALVASDLQTWADGCLEAKTAVQLLIDYDRGHLLDGPWIVQTPVLRRHRFRPDPEDYSAECRKRFGLTERDALVLQVAASVISVDFPGVPVDKLLELDRTTLALVLTAFAHIATVV